MPTPVQTANAPAPFSRYSQAMRTRAGSDLVFVSGQVGVDGEGRLAGTPEGQHVQVWRNLLAILAAQGLTAHDIVEVTAYVTEQAHVPVYRTARDRMLDGAEPASTLLVISGLADPAWCVEISVVAEAPAG